MNLEEWQREHLENIIKGSDLTFDEMCLALVEAERKKIEKDKKQPEQQQETVL